MSRDDDDFSHAFSLHDLDTGILAARGARYFLALVDVGLADLADRFDQRSANFGQLTLGHAAIGMAVAAIDAGCERQLIEHLDAFYQAHIAHLPHGDGPAPEAEAEASPPGSEAPSDGGPVHIVRIIEGGRRRWALYDRKRTLRPRVGERRSAALARWTSAYGRPPAVVRVTDPCAPAEAACMIAEHQGEI